MGGGVPSPPPPVNPMRAAKANDLFYKGAIETMISRQDDLVGLETRLREKYQPRQRRLESELAALDTRRMAESQLQTERELGPQRTLEQLRRQYEMNPDAFAMNRALGRQNALAMARLTGINPANVVPDNIQNNAGLPPTDYLTGIPRTGVI